MSDLSARINDVIGIGPGRVNDGKAMAIMAGYCALACTLPATGAFLKYISGSQKHTPHFYRKTWGKQFNSMMIIILIFQLLSQAIFFIAGYNYQGKLLALMPESGGLSILLKILIPVCVVFIIANPILVRMNFVKNRLQLLTGFTQGPGRIYCGYQPVCQYDPFPDLLGNFYGGPDAGLGRCFGKGAGAGH